MYSIQICNPKMAQLNEQQLNQIYDILNDLGISYESLKIDLLDHISCMVEEKMDEGLSFNESLHLSVQEFGQSNIKDTQETTVYVLNSNHNMKKTEKVILAIIIISIVMKLLHLPFSSALLLLTISTTSLIYFYLGFALFNGIRVQNIFKKSSYKGISAKRIIGAIGTGYALSISIIGILFMLMQWPGANKILVVGMTGLIIIAITCFIKTKRDKDSYYLGILRRVVFFSVICSISLLFSLVN